MHSRYAGAIAVLVVLSVCIACRSSQTGQSDTTSSTWLREVDARRAGVQRVIEENQKSFDAFDSGSLGSGTLEMIPYVVFRVLQDLETLSFGDDSLSSNGFFPRQDMPSGHNGIVWTQPVASDGTFQLRYMTRTCSSCHVGRVRLTDGTMRLIRGGANTEINLHRFIGQLTSTLKTNLAASADAPQYQAFRKRIVDALASHDPGWFYGSSNSAVPAAEAAREVASVTANIDAVLSLMRAMNDQRLTGIGLLQAHSYSHATKAPSLTGGAPGLVETSGLGSASLVSAIGADKADLVLPPAPSKADIPAVWHIDPTGYANWDGTIRGFARSLTSSMAVVGNPAKIDISTNVLIQNLLGKLPPEPYPFPIDGAARKAGEALFQTNCAGCHAAPAGRKRSDLVFDVGTDPLRSQAILPMAVGILRSIVTKICPKELAECSFDGEGSIVDPSPKRGYLAGSLEGAWAVAPYLHNGSIPTLRQLLVPSLRTNAAFWRGSTSYNQQDGGWEWRPSQEKQLRDRGDRSIALQDPSETGLGNAGHGSINAKMAVDGRGNNVQIAWSDSPEDRVVVNNLIAYLLSK